MSFDAEPRILRVELDLVPATKPIRGWVHRAGGAESFTGWLELVQLLEQLHNDSDREQGDRP